MFTISASEAKAKRLTHMRKGVCAAAKAIDDKFRAEYGEPTMRNGVFRRSSPYRTALVTLTYRPDAQWEPKHIAELIKHYREWFKRKHKLVFHYVWTVELQGNGKPHYHLVAWFPRGVVPPLPDKQGWWQHGMTNAVFARSPVGYIAKYASKTEGKSAMHLPKRARLWGYGGLSGTEKAPVLISVAPRWLKFLIPEWAMPRKRVIDLRAMGNFSAPKPFASAWVLTCAGVFSGWAYFGPYEFQDLNRETQSLVVSHRGFIEVLTPNDGTFTVTHSEQ
ncbi:MAG: adhesin [Lysobacter sp.]|nr:adhesin [Lysobacter sp.]